MTRRPLRYAFGALGAALAMGLTALTAGAPGAGAQSGEFRRGPDPTNASVVYLGGSAGSGSLLKSSTGGASWSAIDSGGTSPHADQHCATFDANGLLVEGNDGGVWRLTNPNVGSISWTDLNGTGSTAIIGSADTRRRLRAATT